MTTRFLAMLLFGLCGLASSQYEGDSCFHQATKRNGVCKPIGNCMSAIQGLQQQIYPQTCSLGVSSPIVCCPTEQTTPTRGTTSKPPINPVTPSQPNVNIREPKSIAMCREYAKSVYEVVTLPTLAAGNRPNRTVDTCDRPPLTLIVGGTLAKEKEFPHMAALGYDNSDNERVYVCGGSLISERYVLTAGHCLATRDYGDPKSVRLGDLDLKNENDADPVEYNVVQVIPHPDYDPPLQYNDIGLLKLHEDVVFTPYIRPVCLNVLRKFAANQNVTATGWGNTKFMGTTSSALRKVTLEQFSHSECKTHFKVNRRKLNNGIVDETQLCAGSYTEKKDTCQGDSGGPLTIYNTDVYCMYDLVGVTSFGKACGLVNTPGVYTRVSHFAPWIESVVWP